MKVRGPRGRGEGVGVYEGSGAAPPKIFFDTLLTKKSRNVYKKVIIFNLVKSYLITSVPFEPGIQNIARLVVQCVRVWYPKHSTIACVMLCISYLLHFSW